MGDNFQILNLTENPFPQNPVIIIDGNDKRIFSPLSKSEC